MFPILNEIEVFLMTEDGKKSFIINIAFIVTVYAVLYFILIYMIFGTLFGFRISFFKVFNFILLFFYICILLYNTIKN